jgi:hypothetical protein
MQLKFEPVHQELLDHQALIATTALPFQLRLYIKALAIDPPFAASYLKFLESVSDGYQVSCRDASPKKAATSGLKFRRFVVTAGLYGCHE